MNVIYEANYDEKPNRDPLGYTEGFVHNVQSKAEKG